MALREAGALLAMGGLGGLWAVAWGQRRSRRPERAAMLDARTQLQVRLDALRARTTALARGGLPADARELVDTVVEQEVLIHTVLSRAASAEDVADLDAELADAFINVEEAAQIVGASMPADRPFAGLCGADPAHGLAAATGVRPALGLALCPDCLAAADRGVAPARRLVTVGGRPVPFDEYPAFAGAELSAPGA